MLYVESIFMPNYVADKRNNVTCVYSNTLVMYKLIDVLPIQFELLEL